MLRKSRILRKGKRHRQPTTDDAVASGDERIWMNEKSGI